MRNVFFLKCVIAVLIATLVIVLWSEDGKLARARLACQEAYRA